MILTDHFSHRPWPLRAAPWVMHQAWNDFLFHHWRVDPAVVRALVPEPLELDLHEGNCYLGIIPFHMTDVRPRGTVNVPGLSAFPELNVRTYVRHATKPGVYFLSLDADNRIAVETARATYHLPYFKANIQWQRQEDGIVYGSVRNDRRAPSARWEGRYTPYGDYSYATPGSLVHWLSERYALFTVDGSQTVWRTDIHHLPWPLRNVRVEIEANTMAQALGIGIEGEGMAQYSPGVDVVVWAPTRSEP